MTSASIVWKVETHSPNIFPEENLRLCVLVYVRIDLMKVQNFLKTEDPLNTRLMCIFMDWICVYTSDLRVFKAKYFPIGSIFDAKPKSRSYAWKSILKAQKVILLGARWRIGDGTSIKIFMDSWLLVSNSGQILSPVSVFSKDAIVDQLLDSELRWKNVRVGEEVWPLNKVAGVVR
uniref:Uncharacterized protein n=1 Tax=Quercus lobata TaxID=97700 RepID=A0A7N2MJH0_QUELO